MYGIFTYICLKSTINVGTYFPYILRICNPNVLPLRLDPLPPSRPPLWDLCPASIVVAPEGLPRWILMGKTAFWTPKKNGALDDDVPLQMGDLLFLLLFHVNFQGWCFFWCNFFWGWEFCLGFCFGIKVLDMGIGSEMKKDVSQTFIGEIFRLVSVLIDKISQSMKTWNINEYRITQYHP